MKKKWFEVQAAADGESAEINIFDFIGGWLDDLFGLAGDNGVTTAKSFTDALSKLPESVKLLRVRINSPGGDVFGGTAIANALRAQQERGRTVETIVEGLAASAASIVAMGGSTVRISDNGLLMVHAPWTVAIGNATEIRSMADRLDKIRDTLVQTYQWHSHLTSEEVVALMDGPDGQGSWLDADAALEAGLATEKVEGLRAAASITPAAVAKLKVPEKFAERVKALLQPEAPAAPPAAPPAAGADQDATSIEAPALIQLCRDNGIEDFAVALLEPGQPLTAEAAQARIAAEKQARAAARAREDEIRALCSKARQPDLANGYVAGGMSVDQVRNHLTLITGKLDKVEIDGSLDPDHGTKAKPVIDVVAVYAKRNLLNTKE